MPRGIYSRQGCLAEFLLSSEDVTNTTVKGLLQQAEEATRQGDTETATQLRGKVSEAMIEQIAAGVYQMQEGRNPGESVVIIHAKKRHGVGG